LNLQKAATEALRNIPPSPQLPSGVPVGHYEAKAAVQLQRSAGLGWVGVDDDVHLAPALGTDKWIDLINLADYLGLAFAQLH